MQPNSVKQCFEYLSGGLFIFLDFLHFNMHFKYKVIENAFCLPVSCDLGSPDAVRYELF